MKFKKSQPEIKEQVKVEPVESHCQACEGTGLKNERERCEVCLGKGK